MTTAGWRCIGSTTKAGRPVAGTERPVGLAVDADESVEEIERSLRTALRDLLERPILDVVEIGQARRDPAQPR